MTIINEGGRLKIRETFSVHHVHMCACKDEGLRPVHAWIHEHSRYRKHTFMHTHKLFGVLQATGYRACFHRDEVYPQINEAQNET